MGRRRGECGLAEYELQVAMCNGGNFAGFVLEVAGFGGRGGCLGGLMGWGEGGGWKWGGAGRGEGSVGVGLVMGKICGGWCECFACVAYGKMLWRFTLAGMRQRWMST